MNPWILPFTLQLYVQSIIVFPLTLIFGKPVRFKQGVLVIEWWEWWDRRWPFTTCIWYLFGGSPGADESPTTWFHEVEVHVDQYEQMAVLSDIVALVVYLATGNWILALCIWGTGGPAWLLPGFLTSAKYRKAWKELGWKPWFGLYRFAWFERSAYAQTDVFRRNGGGR